MALMSAPLILSGRATSDITVKNYLEVGTTTF